MPEFAGDVTSELERQIGPLKVVSLVEAGMWLLAAVFWLLGSRVAQLVLWSIHGTVVCAFAGMVLLIFRKLSWSKGFTALAILTGPLGAVAVFVRLRREEPDIRAREQARLAATARSSGPGSTMEP